ncbi:MAG: hypothetical protein QXO40_03510 [Candidatus Aenigmatarchaeota archaeon]
MKDIHILKFFKNIIIYALDIHEYNEIFMTIDWLKEILEKLRKKWQKLKLILKILELISIHLYLSLKRYEKYF